MQNLKSYYEIGSLLGKGNFAKVYEATLISKKDEKFALKTIQKRVLSKCKRNFVRPQIFIDYLAISIGGSLYSEKA